MRTAREATMRVREWLRMTDNSRMIYIMGIVEGWQGMLSLEEQFGNETTTRLYKRVDTCTLPMTFNQMRTIVEKYLKENPSAWHYSMENTAWAAFNRVCPIDKK
jgi:hypothetical protein